MRHRELRRLPVEQPQLQLSTSSVCVYVRRPVSLDRLSVVVVVAADIHIHISRNREVISPTLPLTRLSLLSERGYQVIKLSDYQPITDTLCDSMRHTELYRLSVEQPQLRLSSLPSVCMSVDRFHLIVCPSPSPSTYTFT